MKLTQLFNEIKINTPLTGGINILNTFGVSRESFFEQSLDGVWDGCKIEIQGFQPSSPEIEKLALSDWTFEISDENDPEEGYLLAKGNYATRSPRNMTVFNELKKILNKLNINYRFNTDRINNYNNIVINTKDNPGKISFDKQVI
jgi:hypothetical protein